MANHGQQTEDQPLQNQTLLPYARAFFDKHGLSMKDEEDEDRRVVGLFRSLMREAVETKFMDRGHGWNAIANYLVTRFGLSLSDANNFVGYVTRHPTPTK